MSNHLYEIYQRDQDGNQGEILSAFSRFSATLRFNEVGKWTLSGSTTGFCPLSDQDGIIVYRDGIAFYSGIVTSVIEDVDESFEDGQVVSWTVDGLDDNALLARRILIPDPIGLDLAAASHQTIQDYSGNAIQRYVHTQAGTGAHTSRRVPNLTADSDHDLGPIKSFKARFQGLWDFAAEIASMNSLGIRVIRDPITGQFIAKVYLPEDKSGSVIFAREFGNLRRWTRKREAPQANAVWVAGQGEMTDRAFSYLEDMASILKWGRIEAFKDRRDISNQEDGGATPQQVLDDAAQAFLESTQAMEGFELELAPADGSVFGIDWGLGDIVTVRVGTSEFKAILSEVQIDYAEGIETVTPNVGEINRGTIAKTYASIQAIRERVEVLERNEGGGILDLVKKHRHNGADSERIRYQDLLNLPEDSGFRTPTLQNSWRAYGGPYRAPYYRKIGKIVEIGGFVSGGNPATSTIFQLPVGYRPSASLVFIGYSAAGTVRLDITTSGNVVAGQGASSSFISLSGIMFSV